MIRLKELRKTQGMTQQALATQLGITQATLSGWETGKFEIDNSSLILCSTLLGVSTDYLLEITDYPDSINELLCRKLKYYEFNKPSKDLGVHYPEIPFDVIRRIQSGTYKFTEQALEQICVNVGADKNELLKPDLLIQNQFTLSDAEKNLLYCFRLLSPKGQEYILSTMDAALVLYKNENEGLKLVAQETVSAPPVTEDEIKHT